MTLNWGHKITIVLLLFGALMMTLVYKSIQTDYQLVTKDYYKDELQYQQVIDGSNNAASLSALLQISQTENGIVISFPQEMKDKTITGEYWFYCPYRDKNDRRIEISAGTDAIQVITREQLAAATYTIKTSWKADGTTYYNEQSFTVQ
jgi:hypothetical protein